MVKKYVDVLGGQIVVESTEGIGSKFIVALPVKLSLLTECEVGKNISYTR